MCLVATVLTVQFNEVVQRIIHLSSLFAGLYLH